jgi:hypothetical protein
MIREGGLEAVRLALDLSRPLLGPAQLGHVARRTGDADQLAGLAQQRQRVQAEDHAAAVAVQPHGLEVVHRLPGQHVHQGPAVALGHLRRLQVGEAQPDQLLRLVAQHATGGAVHEGEPALQVQRPDEVAAGLHDEPVELVAGARGIVYRRGHSRSRL